jgi:two-component system CheB/CheR fusion protein
LGDSTALFNVVDRAAKLFTRKEDPQRDARMALGRLLQAANPWGPKPSTPTQIKASVPMIEPMKELTELALLQDAAPSAALVNAHGGILYLHGRMGRYLEPAAGEAGISNILVMAREGLKRELTTALHKAVNGGQTACASGLHVRVDGTLATLDLSVRPLKEAADGKEHGPALFLVSLVEEVPPAAGAPAPAATEECADEGPGMAAMRRELAAKDEYQQTTAEQLRSANEEMGTSNEEMQSINEELQSANEELETSKEELQSLNEELSTVNAELQGKVADLSQVNNDMNNLLAGTGIATVFVDHQLRILRFTPAATRLINLIPGDVKRPIGDIVSNLVGYGTLVDDVKKVLDTLQPMEVAVESKDGHAFNMRLQPYRTLENVVEGAVITFVDVTEMKRTAEALRVAQADLKAAQGKV